MIQTELSELLDFQDDVTAKDVQKYLRERIDEDFALLACKRGITSEHCHYQKENEALKMLIFVKLLDNLNDT